MTDFILPTDHRFVNITGNRYGRLVVVSYAGKNKVHSKWLCLCDCGSNRIIQGSNLKSGHTKSCGGCLHTPNNMAWTREYRSWSGMKTRCLNPNYDHYQYYGGRGITVCDRWLNSFENFLEDMGEKPSPKHSIDRINNDGNYEPENCKWSTSKEQQSNTRNNRFIEINGEKLTIIDASRKYIINYSMLRKRLERGWSVERAIT